MFRSTCAFDSDATASDTLRRSFPHLVMGTTFEKAMTSGSPFLAAASTAQVGFASPHRALTSQLSTSIATKGPHVQSSLSTVFVPWLWFNMKCLSSSPYRILLRRAAAICWHLSIQRLRMSTTSLSSSCSIPNALVVPRADAAHTSFSFDRMCTNREAPLPPRQPTATLRLSQQCDLYSIRCPRYYPMRLRRHSVNLRASSTRLITVLQSYCLHYRMLS
jgi:hypothetical protein